MPLWPLFHSDKHHVHLVKSAVSPTSISGSQVKSKAIYQISDSCIQFMFQFSQLCYGLVNLVKQDGVWWRDILWLHHFLKLPDDWGVSDSSLLIDNLFSDEISSWTTWNPSLGESSFLKKGGGSTQFVLYHKEAAIFTSTDHVRIYRCPVRVPKLKRTVKVCKKLIVTVDRAPHLCAMYQWSRRIWDQICDWVWDWGLVKTLRRYE